MKALKSTAIILIVVGIMMILSGRFSYAEREQLIQANSIGLRVKPAKTTWALYAGGVAMATGIILLVVRKKRNTDRIHSALAD
jgi:LPXTG-motif cell wall-anchored protein